MKTNLDIKKEIVKEINSKIEESETVVLFTYQGLSVSQIAELRGQLREVESEMKVYKNTLLNFAFKENGLDLEEFLEGPNAILFGSSLLEPIKVLSEFAKKNKQVEIAVGVIKGEIADKELIAEYASIPSKEGLLTMFAAGLMEHARNFSIIIDLHAKNLEEK